MRPIHLNRSLRFFRGSTMNIQRDRRLNPAFDLNAFRMVGNTVPMLQVEGRAGSVTPDLRSNDILAYVFNTDAGTFAVASHSLEDSVESAVDLDWHAHRITLNEQGCITGIEETGDAYVKGHLVGVLNSGATQLNSVATVVVTPGESGVCVSRVMDSMA
jgi:hypothetical protein